MYEGDWRCWWETTGWKKIVGPWLVIEHMNQCGVEHLRLSCKHMPRSSWNPRLPLPVTVSYTVTSFDVPSPDTILINLIFSITTVGGGHDMYSGIVGKISLTYLGRPAVPALQVLASRENRLWKKISGGAISKDVKVSSHGSVCKRSALLRLAFRSRMQNW